MNLTKIYSVIILLTLTLTCNTEAFADGGVSVGAGLSSNGLDLEAGVMISHGNDKLLMINFGTSVVGVDDGPAVNHMNVELIFELEKILLGGIVQYELYSSEDKQGGVFLAGPEVLIETLVGLVKISVLFDLINESDIDLEPGVRYRLGFVWPL